MEIPQNALKRPPNQKRQARRQALQAGRRRRPVFGRYPRRREIMAGLIMRLTGSAKPFQSANIPLFPCWKPAKPPRWRGRTWQRASTLPPPSNRPKRRGRRPCAIPLRPSPAAGMPTTCTAGSRTTPPPAGLHGKGRFPRHRRRADRRNQGKRHQRDSRVC